MILTRRLFLGTTLASLMARRVMPQPEAAPRLLTARPAHLRLLPSPAPQTAILGFDGTAPGPLLRCKLGEEIKIRLVNKSGRPLTLANWGLRIASGYDGVGGLTEKPVPHGESRDYLFTPPDAGFFGYRSFVPPQAGTCLRHGLYGGLIVAETAAPEADREIVAILADWQLDAKARITDPAKPGTTSLATLNSRQTPLEEAHAPGSRIRLRLLNAAATRLFFVTFAGVSPRVLAIDGQPCEAFTPVGNLLPIAPGGRFDIMFDLPQKPHATARILLRPNQPLVVFKTAGRRRKDLAPIVSLPRNPLLPEAIRLQASHKAQIVLSGGGAKPFALNGASAANFAKSPLFFVRRGTPVTLTITNKSSVAQQVRLHGHALRILHDLDDGWDPYWRNGVVVAAQRTKHIAFIADNPGKWAIGIIPLDTPGGEMVSWFEVG